MSDATKSNYKTAEAKLLCYRRTKREYEEALGDLAYDNCCLGSGIHAGVSDPTAARVFKLMDRTGDTLLWLNACDEVYRLCTSRGRLLITQRQAAADCGIGWVRMAQAGFVRKMGFAPDERTLRADWREIVGLLTGVALRKKLFFERP